MSRRRPHTADVPIPVPSHPPPSPGPACPGSTPYRRPSIPVPTILYSHRSPSSSSPDSPARTRLPDPSPPSKRLRELAPPPISIPTLQPIEVPSMPACYPQPPSPAAPAISALDPAPPVLGDLPAEEDTRPSNMDKGKGKETRPQLEPIRTDLQPPRMMYQPPLSDSPLELASSEAYYPGIHGLYSKFSMSSAAGSAVSREGASESPWGTPSSLPHVPPLPSKPTDRIPTPRSPATGRPVSALVVPVGGAPTPTLGQALDGVRGGPNAARLSADIPILLGGSLFRQFRSQEVKHARESIQKGDQAAFDHWRSSLSPPHGASPGGSGGSGFSSSPENVEGQYSTREDLQFASPNYPDIPKDPTQDVLHITPPTPQRTGTLALSPSTHMARYLPPPVLVEFHADVFDPSKFPPLANGEGSGGDGGGGAPSPSGTFGPRAGARAARAVGSVDQSPKGKSRMPPLPSSLSRARGERQDSGSSEFTVSAYQCMGIHSRQSTFDAPAPPVVPAPAVPPLPLDRRVAEATGEDERAMEDSPASLALITPPQTQEEFETDLLTALAMSRREAEWFAGHRNSRDVGPSNHRHGLNALGLVDIHIKAEVDEYESDANVSPCAGRSSTATTATTTTTATVRPAASQKGFVSTHPYSSAYVPDHEVEYFGQVKAHPKAKAQRPASPLTKGKGQLQKHRRRASLLSLADPECNELSYLAQFWELNILPGSKGESREFALAKIRELRAAGRGDEEAAARERPGTPGAKPREADAEPAPRVAEGRPPRGTTTGRPTTGRPALRTENSDSNSSARTARPTAPASASAAIAPPPPPPVGDDVTPDEDDARTRRVVRKRSRSWWRSSKELEGKLKRFHGPDDPDRVVAETERKEWEPLEDYVNWSPPPPLRVDTSHVLDGMRRRCSTPVSPKTRKAGEKTPDPSLFRQAVSNAALERSGTKAGKGKGKTKAKDKGKGKATVRPYTSATPQQAGEGLHPDHAKKAARAITAHGPREGTPKKRVGEVRPNTAEGVKNAYLKSLADSRAPQRQIVSNDNDRLQSREEESTQIVDDPNTLSRPPTSTHAASRSMHSLSPMPPVIVRKAEEIEFLATFKPDTSIRLWADQVRLPPLLFPTHTTPLRVPADEKENTRAVSTEFYFVRFHPSFHSRTKRLSTLDISLSTRPPLNHQDQVEWEGKREGEEEREEEGQPFLQQGVLEFEFMPRQAPWFFGYSVMEAAPRLGRVTVNQNETYDYLSRNAALKVKAEGMYSLGGVEQRKHEFVEWKLEYAVRYRYSERTRERIAHERIVIPLSFFCTPSFLHPDNATKLSIVSQISKALKPSVSATQLRGGLPFNPSSVSLALSTAPTIRTGPSAVSLDKPPSSDTIPSSTSTNGSLAKAVEAVVSAFRPTTPGKGNGSGILGSRNPTPKAKGRVKPGTGGDVPPLPFSSSAKIAALTASRPATALPLGHGGHTPLPLSSIVSNTAHSTPGRSATRPATANAEAAIAEMAKLGYPNLPPRIAEACLPLPVEEVRISQPDPAPVEKRGRFRAATLFARRPATSTSTSDLHGAAGAAPLSLKKPLGTLRPSTATTLLAHQISPPFPIVKKSLSALRPSTATALVARQISPPLPTGWSSSNPAAADTSKWPFAGAASTLGSALHLPLGGGGGGTSLARSTSTITGTFALAPGDGSKWSVAGAASALGSSLHLPLPVPNLNLNLGKRKSGRPTSATPTPTATPFQPAIPPRPTFTLGTTTIPADEDDWDDDLRLPRISRTRTELHRSRVEGLPRAHPFSQHLTPIPPPSPPPEKRTRASTATSDPRPRPLLSVLSTPKASGRRPQTAQAISTPPPPLPLSRTRDGEGEGERLVAINNILRSPSSMGRGVTITTISAGTGSSAGAGGRGGRGGGGRGGLRVSQGGARGMRPSTADPRMQTRI